MSPHYSQRSNSSHGGRTGRVAEERTDCAVGVAPAELIVVTSLLALLHRQMQCHWRFSEAGDADLVLMGRLSGSGALPSATRGMVVRVLGDEDASSGDGHVGELAAFLTSASICGQPAVHGDFDGVSSLQKQKDPI